MGGGYGHPHQRPVSAVVDDVKNGYISLDTAEKVYGVQLAPEALEVVGLKR